MNHPDPILARISAGIELRLQGRNAEARAPFEQLWTDNGLRAAALFPSLHLCVATWGEAY